MKYDAGSTTLLAASDPDSVAAWGSKRINLWPQLCLCLTQSRWPSLLRQQQPLFGLHFRKTIFMYWQGQL